MRCRGPNCGAWIGFVQLESGRKHPVDEGKPEIYYLRLGDREKPQLTIVTTTGVILRGREVTGYDDGALRVEGWTSHMSTCPDAADLTRRR